MHRITTLLLVLALGITACGGDDAGDPDGGAAAGDTATTVAAGDDGGGDDATLPTDACALVSAASVNEAAAGATAAPTDGLFDGAEGPSVGCRWDDGGFVYPLEVSVTSGTGAYDYGRELVENLGGMAITPVTGVGDDAFSFDDGAGSTELYARTGDLVVTVRSTSDPAVVTAIANEVILGL